MQALIGSANFTNNGIFSNNELSVVLSDIQAVSDLHNWYESWWGVSTDIDVESINDLAQGVKKISPSPLLPNITSDAPRIKARHAIPADATKEEQYHIPLTESAILAYFEQWNNQKWEREFFRLLRTAITASRLPKDSPYLAVTITKTMKITCQVNNRVILASHSKGKNSSLTLMLPLEFESQVQHFPNIFAVEHFGSKQRPESLLVRFVVDDLAILESSIVNLWIQAIQAELQRKFKSPFKRFHQNILYDIALNDSMLDEMFEIM
jgi:hypothetical protein